MANRLITTSEGSQTGAFAGIDWLLILAAGGTWGASFLFMAEALDAYKPGAITFARIGIGFLTLTAFRRNAVPVAPEDRRRIVLLAATWMAIPLTLFPIAQNHISSSLAGMINGTTPVAVAAVATVLLGRWPGTWQRAGLVCGTAGLVLIAWPSLQEGGSSLFGAALVCGAVACYGIAINMAVPLQQRYGGLNVLWHVLGVATVMTFPLGLLGLSQSSPAAWPTACLVALGAGGTGLAFVAMATVTGRAGSTRGSVTIYLTPPIAIGLGVLVRDETVAGVALIGSAFVLVGAWLAGRPDNRRVDA